jgi:hypothetical protein
MGKFYFIKLFLEVKKLSQTQNITRSQLHNFSQTFLNFMVSFLLFNLKRK